MSEHFGQLREFLQTPPADQRWGQLCMLLEDFSGHELLELALPYVEAHLKRWPDLERRAPMLWLNRALEGRPEPRLQLCRTLHTNRQLTRDQALGLAQSEDLDHIRALNLTQNNTQAEHLELLTKARWWDELMTLTLQSTFYGAVSFERMRLGASLTTLSLRDFDVTVARRYLVRLAQLPGAERLKVLSIGQLDASAITAHDDMLRVCQDLDELNLIYHTTQSTPQHLVSMLPKTLSALRLTLHEDPLLPEEDKLMALKRWSRFKAEGLNAGIEVSLEIASI